jgi:hypothetical protein
MSGRPNRQKPATGAGGEPARTNNPKTPIMKKLLALSVATLVFAALPAKAQRSQRSTPIELGIDGGVLFGLNTPRTTVVALPIQSFRVGFLVTDNLALEPRAAINSIHGGGASVTTYDFALGVVYQPDGDRVGKGLYGRPFLGVSGISVSGAAGNNNNGYMGLGVGLKLPFADRRLATRMEVNYEHGFGGGGSNLIGVLIGLSFFTR